VHLFLCREEASEYIEIGALNGLFVLGRSIGFIGKWQCTEIIQWICAACHMLVCRLILSLVFLIMLVDVMLNVTIILTPGVDVWTVHHKQEIMDNCSLTRDRVTTDIA